MSAQIPPAVCVKRGFMVSFFVCLAILIDGYFVCGKLASNTFAPDDRDTPAVKSSDGVDYAVLPRWKLFLLQLINISGPGPVFAALQGALWGPMVFLWITFGTLLAGGIHDYFAGMMSTRTGGSAISETAGIYLGSTVKNITRVLSLVLLILLGAAFAVGPAGLIVTLLRQSGAEGMLTAARFWLSVILVCYFVAAFFPIDKLIGRVCPIFSICLILMAAGVACGIVIRPEYTIPEIWSGFRSMHPAGVPPFPFMLVTTACGVISGFHAAQSPLMARCMKSERQGRSVFYGAMVCEGIIALIWAAAGCALYPITGGLNTGLQAILDGSQAAAVFDVCAKTMGGAGIFLAAAGIIACPIASGGTAFRSARLMLAGWLKLDQRSCKNRLILCIPVLGAGAFLGIGSTMDFIDYAMIWRCFSWTNLTLAMIVLWAASMYLFYDRKNYWLTAVPAVFMSAVSATYFILAPECLGRLVNTFSGGRVAAYNTIVAYPAGTAVAALFLGIFLYSIKKRNVRPRYTVLKK